MGAELLEESSHAKEKSYTEVFEESFPFYLAIGMSYGQYWEGDPKLAQYYRKAYAIKQEEFNNNAWLQGMYVYDAVSTAIHNAMRGMGKSRTPAKEYAKAPYDISKKEKTEAQKLKIIEKEQEKAAAWMENLVQRNKRA